MMVPIPAKIPLLRLATFLLVVAVFVWLALEGRLLNVLILAIWTTLVGWGHIVQRLWGGKAVRLWRFLAMMVVCGLVGGLLTNLLVLILMVMKTGIHGHGPEFNQEQIQWVIQQLPLWLTIGTLLGLGSGLALGSTVVGGNRPEQTSHDNQDPGM